MRVLFCPVQSAGMASFPAGLKEDGKSTTQARIRVNGPLWIELLGLIEEAVARPAYQPVVTGADGRLLRSAASVAAKLA